jgi:hypothetical protein
MNPRTTLRLVLLALALLAYILVFERHTPDSRARAEAAGRLFPGFTPADVQRIEIARSNLVVRADRAAGQWRLADPAYPAQSGRIDDWLGSVGQLRRRTTLSAGDLRAQPAGLAAFGLEPPQATVSLHLGARVLQFRLGLRTPVGEKAYLQIVGDSGVHVTEAAVLDRLPAAAGDWRDPAFVHLASLKFDRVRVTTGGRDFELSLDPAARRWQLVKPRPARADSVRVEQVLQQLQALRVERFVADQPLVDLEPFGLHQPAVSVAVLDGTNQVFAADFGRSPTNTPGLVYARRAGYPDIVAVGRRVVDALAAPYTDFLDYRLVDVPAEAVDRVEVRAAEAFTLARQTNGAWRVTAPRAFAADSVLVEALLRRLGSLTILDVAKEVVTEPDLPNYGLAPPSGQFVLHAAGGSNAVALRLDFGTNRADRIYARRGDENPVYRTKADDVRLLPRAAFELRERRLWDFATNEVRRLVISQAGREFELLRGAGGQWTFAAGSQGIVNTFALEEAVYRLGRLWARAWVARGSAEVDLYGFAQVDHRLMVELEEGGAPRVLRLEFGATSPSGGPFARAEVDGEPTVFEFPIEVFLPYQEAVQNLLRGAGR